MNLGETTSRRDFIKTTAAATLAGLALPAMLRAGTAPAIVSGTNLNSRIGIGFIGTGHRAGSHMKMLENLKEQEQMPIELCRRSPSPSMAWTSGRKRRSAAGRSGGNWRRGPTNLSNSWTGRRRRGACCRNIPVGDAVEGASPGCR